MKIVQLPVVVSYDEDVYIAKCPTIQGAFAQGETPEDAVKELINVIQMIKEYRKERGEAILPGDALEATEMEITLPVEV